MRPEIEAYIRKHGARYTTEALRRMLIGVGHDPAEVDAALRETEAVRGPQLIESRTFGRWALLLHAGALVAMVLLVVLLNGTEAFGIALIGAVVLGLFLLLGWAVSSLIGRALLPRTGLMVAIVVPLISALALSGTCVAIMDGMTPEPPRTGSAELTIDQPFSFDGSGMAFCYGEMGGIGFGFSAENLGTVDDGRSVSAFVDSYAGRPERQAPAPRPDELGVSITLSPLAETDPPAAWRNSVTTELELELSGNGGSVTFDGLSPEPMGVPNPASTDSEPMSGALTWICDPPR